MKNLKSFKKLYILADGSSFWKDSCDLICLNSNISYSILNVDCFRHYFWNIENTFKTTNVLPIYSRIFKL